MKSFIALLVLGLAVTSMPLGAADDSGKKPAAAKPVAGTRMDPAKGRFHRVHAKKLSLQCDTCHAGEQKDVLFLRSGEPQGLGPVDRHVCLDCHKSPAKPAWYDVKTKK